MTRIKKTRTERSIGAAKKPLEKQSSSKATLAKKKGKGRPAGAKANIDGARKKAKPKSKQSINPQDLMVGSKKAIQLVVTPKKQPMTPKVTIHKVKPTPAVQQQTPEQELAAIEIDERLNELLDSLDNNIDISAADQSYVEQLTARHQQLMIDLGLTDEEEEEKEDDISDSKKIIPSDNEQDMWNRFDDANLDDYRDES